jgi:hypothetical protein
VARVSEDLMQGVDLLLYRPGVDRQWGLLDSLAGGDPAAATGLSRFLA